MTKTGTEQQKLNIPHLISYILLRLVCFIINLIPYRTAVKLAGFLGYVVYYGQIPRRKIAIDNLRCAYEGRFSDDQIRSIARQSFSSLVLLFVEFIRIPKLIKNFGDYVTIEREEVVWQGLEKGNGVILLISHYGNWELMAVMAGIIGYPISAVGRPMKNKYIYHYIEGLRQYSGLKSLDKKGAAKEILSELKANRVVAILFDQYAGRAGIAVPFFGRPAYTTSAVAQIAMRTGARVIPAFITRYPDGKHKIYVEDPVEHINTGNKQYDTFKNTEKYNQILEKWVNKNPHLWFWFHKRWKQPRGIELADKKSGN